MVVIAPFLLGSCHALEHYKSSMSSDLETAAPLVPGYICVKGGRRCSLRSCMPTNHGYQIIRATPRKGPQLGENAHFPAQNGASGASMMTLKIPVISFAQLMASSKIEATEPLKDPQGPEVLLPSLRPN